MSFRSRSKRRGGPASSRGFSLIEMVVSLLILVMVMIVALSLLFSMKSFAERQAVKTAPRQTARRAVDYLSFFVAGATDLNDTASPPSPNAIVTWFSKPQGGGKNILKQASFNNLKSTAPENTYGEPGTDIISLAVPVDPLSIPFTKWPGKLHGATAWINYTIGCPDNAALEANFKKMTGAHLNAKGNEVSDILTVTDAVGSWAYYQITSYQQFVCGSVDSQTGEPDPIHVVANPGGSATDGTDPINPPGGEPDLIEPVALGGGMRFYSFRVRRGVDGVPNLEQKQGLFDVDYDTPGNNFVPILPDVEDFQIAYLYSLPPDPTKTTTVFNTTDSSGTLVEVDDGAAGQHVPPQATGSTWDIANVAGLRFSITARSQLLRFTTAQISRRRGTATETNFRPLSEDRAKADPDDYEVPGATAGDRVGDFDHFRMTSTLLLRNRMLGN